MTDRARPRTNLKRQLRRLHITHDQIAARARVSRTYVCHYLAGRRRAAKVKHAVADLIAARSIEGSV